MLVAEIIILASTMLGVDYAVQNTTGADIYVFDRVFTRAQSGEPQIDPSLAYRRLHDDGTLVVEKALQPIPPGMKVELPEIPYLTRVAPGGTVRGRIVLALPVQEFGAYWDGPRDGTEKAATRIMLRIGYLSVADIGPGMAVVRPDPGMGEGAFAASYGMAQRLQRFLDVDLGPPPLPLTVSRPRQ